MRLMRGFGDAIERLTWRFHWNWNTQQALNEAESKGKGDISNVLRWIWFTEKTPAAGREYNENPSTFHMQ